MSSNDYSSTKAGIGSSADPDLLSNDEVYDECDQAQWVQLSEIASIRKRAEQMNAPERHPDFDGIHCLDCDEPLVKGRLSLGKIRCVECQRILEIKQKQYSS